MKRGMPLGFTLIELMMVVAIIGLLAAIAIPKFAGLVVKAKEAAVRGKMGSVRSAIAIYYADTEGIWPALTTPYFGGGIAPYSNPSAFPPMKIYLDAWPSISIPTVPSHVQQGAVIDSLMPNDSLFAFGLAWLYNRNTGIITANCTHMDSRGVQWTTQ